MELITREGKGSKLTIQEMDGNLNYLDNKVPYKIYTALLTQSGKSVIETINSGLLEIGVTYIIRDNGDADFTNVGAPNNDIDTPFVATETTPNSWGSSGILEYDSGAPIVTVLENTIGNIWFTGYNTGAYKLHNPTLNDPSKLYLNISSREEKVMGITWNDEDGEGVFILSSFITGTGTQRDNGILQNTSIEIRLYN